MKLAVYAPCDAAYPLVLTPECMQPTLACVHAFGSLQFRGTLDIDEGVLRACASTGSEDASALEFVVHSEDQAHDIAEWMQSPQLAPIPCPAIIAPTANRGTPDPATQ